MIRGRILRGGGARNLSLSMLCDIAWVEIYDDCSPMGDSHQYRRIVTELFIDGKDPFEIFYEVTEYDKKGKPKKKQRRLADAPTSVSRGQQMSSALSVLEQWKARAAQLKEEQALASTPDGEG